MSRIETRLITLACLATLMAGCSAFTPGEVATPGAEPTPAASSPSATPTYSTAPAPTPVPGLEQVRDLLHTGDEVDIGVFGDSTGDEMTEWPALWAQEMSSDQAVTLNRWISSTQRYQPETLGETGRRRTIWNCSVSGWKPINFYPIVGKCLPEDTDMVIISLGHNNNSDPTQTLPQLETLLGIIRAQQTPQVPIVITMQNKVTSAERQPAADEVTRIIAEWAIAHDYPIVDAYHAFVDSPRGVEALLKADGLHPNEDGSRVWADTVITTLTPWRE